MSHQAPLAAAHAANAASRSGAQFSSDTASQDLSARAEDRHQSPPSVALDARAIDLLARVLAQGLLQDPLVILICSCSAGVAGGSIAAAFAAASASRFGRTLLLDACVSTLPPIPLLNRDEEYAAGGRALPDAFVPGLYHQDLNATWCNSRPPHGAALLAHISSLASGYTMVVVNSPSLHSATASLALAGVCTASILSCQAGVTRSSEVNDMARDIASVGGRVIGTVLAGVPAGLPRWIERSCGLS